MKQGEDFSRKEIEAYNKGYRIDKDGIISYEGHKVNGCQKEVYKEFSYRDLNNKVKHCKFHRLQAYQKFGDKIYEKGMVVRH